MEELHCCYFCVESLEDRKGLSFFMISLSSFLDEYKYFGSTFESLLKFSSMEDEVRRQKLLRSLMTPHTFSNLYSNSFSCPVDPGQQDMEEPG